MLAGAGEDVDEGGEAEKGKNGDEEGEDVAPVVAGSLAVTGAV